MTEAEEACFRAARELQREEILSQFQQQLRPVLPFFKYAKYQSLPIRIIYFLLILIVLPLLLLIWIVRIALNLIQLPFHYGATYFLPKDFRPPGERNIQGMHSAFTPYVNLSPIHYIECFNTWIKLLYGEQAALEYQLENYFDVKLLREKPVGDEAIHLRNSLRIARERISRELGHYS